MRAILAAEVIYLIEPIELIPRLMSELKRTHAPDGVGSVEPIINHDFLHLLNDASAARVLEYAMRQPDKFLTDNDDMMKLRVVWQLADESEGLSSWLQSLLLSQPRMVYKMISSLAGNDWSSIMIKYKYLARILKPELIKEALEKTESMDLADTDREIACYFLEQFANQIDVQAREDEN